MNKTREALHRTEHVTTNKITTLEDQLSKSQSLYVELDQSTRAQIDKLKTDTVSEKSELTKRYEAALRKKDDALKSAMTEND